VTALIAKGRTFLRTEERFMHRHCCKQASLRVEEIPRSCRFFLGCVRRFQLRARLGPPWRQRDTHSLARRSTSHHRLFQAFPRVNRTLLTFRNPIPCASSSTSEPPASSPWQPWRFSVPAASSVRTVFALGVCVSSASVMGPFSHRLRGLRHFGLPVCFTYLTVQPAKRSGRRWCVYCIQATGI
jgi:hypothetical protein